MFYKTWTPIWDPFSLKILKNTTAELSPRASARDLLPCWLLGVPRTVQDTNFTSILVRFGGFGPVFLVGFGIVLPNFLACFPLV